MDNTLAAQANRIAELEAECDHWHSHYDAAVQYWNLCLTERDQLQAQVAALRGALEYARHRLNLVYTDENEAIFHVIDEVLQKSATNAGKR